MNYALSHPTSAGGLRRGGLLGAVIALHAGVLLLLLTVKSVAPELLEKPLMVQFIEPPKPVEVVPEPPAAKPLPMAAPRPAARPKEAPKPKLAPKPAEPRLETTTSTEPAPASAPLVAAAEPAPAPAAKTGDAGALAGRGDSDGGVVGARFDADYLKNPAPPYPPQSRRLGEEGKVILRVFVSADGNAQQVELKTSSGSSRLDDSALRTVRHWKFIPARRGGAAVESWVLVPILFKLES